MVVTFSEGEEDSGLEDVVVGLKGYNRLKRVGDVAPDVGEWRVKDGDVKSAIWEKPLKPRNDRHLII